MKLVNFKIDEDHISLNHNNLKRHLKNSEFDIRKIFQVFFLTN